MVFQYDLTQGLPTAADLPDSDETPVDNELQNLIPNLLSGVLAMAWSERIDWFFGVDMGVYYHPGKPAVVPDGFLSLGVNRFVGGEEGRLSYVLWEEASIPPILALEVVSKTYGGEYERKKKIYADIGILYYAVYHPNPRGRYRQQPFAVFQLVNKTYEPLAAQVQGERFWLPEIALGLGRERGSYQGREREWLYWYDKSGNRLLTPEEKAEQEAARAEQEAARADRLAAQLKALGIDPEQL